MQGRIQIGGTAGRELVHIAAGGIQGTPVYGLQLGLPNRDAVVKTDDGEMVRLAELAQDKAEGIPRLLELFAAHAARAVQDKDNVLGNCGAGRQRQVGGKEEQKVALAVTVGPAGEQAAAKAALGRGKEQLKIGAGAHVPGLPVHPRPAGAWPLDDHVVARRIDAGQARRGADLHGDGCLLQGQRRVALGAEDVAVAVEAAPGQEPLLVFEAHGARGAGAQIEIEGQALPAGVLQQRGVVLADDGGPQLGVGGLPVLAGGRPGLAVDLSLETGEDGIGRQGEEVAAGQGDVVGVVEFLLDAGHGVIAVYGDGDVVTDHGQVAGVLDLERGQDHAVGQGGLGAQGPAHDTQHQGGKQLTFHQTSCSSSLGGQTPSKLGPPTPAPDPSAC